MNKENIPVNFKGIEQKTDPKQVSIGRTLGLINAVFRKTGQLLKRYGFSVFTVSSDQGTLSSGKAVFGYKNEVLLQDNSSLYSYSAQQNKWITKSNNLKTFDFNTKNILFDQIAKEYQDTAFDPVTGYQIFVFTDFTSSTISLNQCYYSIVERSTGNVIIQKAFIGYGLSKVFLFNSRFVVLNYATGAINLITIPCATPSTPNASVVLASGGNTTPLFDATIVGSYIYVSFYKSSNAVEIYRLDNTFTGSLRNSFNPTGVTLYSLCIAGYDSSHIRLLFSGLNGSAAYFAGITFDDTANSFGTIVTTAVTKIPVNLAAICDSSFNCYYTFNVNVYSYNVDSDFGIHTGTFYGTSFANDATVTTGVRQVSKLFLFNSDYYYFCVPTATQYYDNYGFLKEALDQQTLYLCRSGITLASGSPALGRFTPVAKIANGNAYLQPDNSISLPEVVQFTENSVSKILFSYLEKSTAFSDLGGISFKSGVKSVEVFYEQGRIQRKTLARNLNMSGGQVMIYDGENVVESGFNTYPSIIDIPKLYGANGSLGVLSEVTDKYQHNYYQYVAVYEWLDEQGQKHRSAPSVPIIKDVYPFYTSPTQTVTVTAGSPLYQSSLPYDEFSRFSALNVPLSLSTFPANTQITNIYPYESTPGNFVGIATMSANSTSSGTPSESFIYTPQLPRYDLITTVNSDIVKVGTIYTSGPQVGHALGPYPGGGLVTAVPKGTKIIKDLGSGYYRLDQKATATDTQPYSPYNFWKMSVKISNLALTGKQNVSLVLYRTALNGTVFYRVSDSKNLTYSSSLNYYTTVIDNVSDYELITHEQLYTVGGEIENIAPPAPEFFCAYKDRLMLVPKDNKLQIWYSKQAIAGFPVEFTDSFVLQISELGGDITGLSVLDEKLIIFKENHIFYMIGDGPTASGINNDFSAAQLISSNVGCIDANSIVNIKEGLLFQSTEGICLLGRDFVVYVQEDIDDLGRLPIASVQLLSDQKQVRYALKNGTHLIFDTEAKQWSTSQGSGDALAQVDSEMISDSYYFLNAAGVLKKENPTNYSDYQTVAGVQTQSYIPMSIDTSWISLANLEGYQRIYELILLGNYVSNHTMTVQVYYDFNESYFDTVTIGDAIPAGAPDVFRYRIFMPRQKCTSIRFKFSEVPVNGTFGEGLKISSMTLKVGMKQGLDKISQANTYG